MNYDDDPRYEKLEDGVYRDTETHEVVMVFEGEAAVAVQKAFDLERDTVDYKLSQDDWRKILGDKFNKSEYDHIFDKDSDLTELD